MSNDNPAAAGKKRIEWVDALKGLGIILVTLGHLHPWLPLETYIYSFHMCLFFFLSGYLFKQADSFGTFVVKRIKSILVPFLIWDLISSICDLILGGSFDNVLRAFFMINGKICLDTPIWFLLVLFMTEILYAAITKINRSIVIPITVCLAGIVLWFFFGSYQLTLKLNLIPLALCFYSLGDFFHRVHDEKNVSRRIIIPCIAAAGTISIVFGAILNIRIAYTTATFGNLFYCIPAAIAGTLFYYLIFKNWMPNGNKVLNYLGRNSMIIMITQYFLFLFFNIISQKLFHINIQNIRSTVKAVAMTIITIGIIMLCDFLFKRIFRNHKTMLKIGTYLGIR